MSATPPPPPPPDSPLPLPRPSPEANQPPPSAPARSAVSRLLGALLSGLLDAPPVRSDPAAARRAQAWEAWMQGFAPPPTRALLVPDAEAMNLVRRLRHDLEQLSRACAAEVATLRDRRNQTPLGLTMAYHHLDAILGTLIAVHRGYAEAIGATDPRMRAVFPGAPAGDGPLAGPSYLPASGSVPLLKPRRRRQLARELRHILRQTERAARLVLADVPHDDRPPPPLQLAYVVKRVRGIIEWLAGEQLRLRAQYHLAVQQPLALPWAPSAGPGRPGSSG